MAFWITTFYRQNFSFGRKVEQTADVVFESDVEENVTVEDEMQLANDAGKAFREQTNWTVEQKPPIGGGFSSTMRRGGFERLSIPHIDREIEKPSEGKPVIACGFSYNGNKYRATGFYRLHKYVKEYDPDSVEDQIFREMQIEDGKDPDRVRYQMIKCLPEDADFVSGSGVAGCIAPIKKVKVGELVAWEDLVIKQAQGEYADKIAKYTENDILTDQFHLGPYIKHYLEELES